MTISMDCQTVTVGELLSGAKVFRMPVFQRPFAWTEDEAAQLIDDLLTAHQHWRHVSESDQDFYFLGQIIVARRSPNAPYEVIDGQQRPVTLSCILAVLRDLLPASEFRDDL